MNSIPTAINCVGLLDPVGVVFSGVLETLKLIKLRRGRGCRALSLLNCRGLAEART